MSLDNNGQSGSITRFVVHNDYMYVLNLNEVKTFSLSDPDNPQLVNVLTTDFGLETIIIYDETIFIGSTNALYILGIDQPDSPVLLSKSDRGEILLEGCDPVVVKDHFAYSTIKIINNICGIINAVSALVVYDIEDKLNPVFISQYPMNQPNGLGYKGNYLLVCDGGNHLVEVFDISNPHKVVLTDYSFGVSDPVDIIIKGEQAIISSKKEFRLYDISDIENIRPLGVIGK
nr:hypothetical protein [Saprospiraceae bacterium]